MSIKMRGKNFPLEWKQTIGITFRSKVEASSQKQLGVEYL